MLPQGYSDVTDKPEPEGKAVSWQGKPNLRCRHKPARTLLWLSEEASVDVVIRTHNRACETNTG